MAHSCPDCDATCYCDGDVDDAILEEGSLTCTHCDDQEESLFDDYDLEDEYDDEDDEEDYDS